MNDVHGVDNVFISVCARSEPINQTVGGVKCL